MSLVRWDQFRQPRSVDAVVGALQTLHELSRWWMTQEAKQLARDIDENDHWLQPPTLPSEIGTCWIMTLNPDLESHEILQPSFVFPLIWLPNREHDFRLPPALRRLADNVLTTIRGRSLLDVKHWGLQVFFESRPWLADSGSEGFDYPDLSQLGEDLYDFTSGWVSLAAALLAACQNKASDTSVWATGGWDDSSGVTEVDGISQKLMLARDYFECHADEREPKDCTVLVPSPNLIEANRFKSDRRNRCAFNILPFPRGELKPDVSLGRYLALLKVKPPADGSVEDHVAYYKSRLGDDAFEAGNYYEAVLFPMVVEQCRARLQDITPRPTHLVSVVSPNNELVSLAVRVFGIQHLLMLHTSPTDHSDYGRHISDMEILAQQAAEDCRSAGCDDVVLAPFSYDATRPNFRVELGETLRAIVDKHYRSVNPELVALDMHGGFKIFSYALERAVAKPGNLLYWIDHRWFPGLKKQSPMTERFITWRKGDDRNRATIPAVSQEASIENQRTTYLLNTPVMTAYGQWHFDGPIDPSLAKQVLTGGFVSAIGHSGAAKFLGRLLGVDVAVNRMSIQMRAGDQAIVLRLKQRLPEGAVLTDEEMLALPFELGLLRRIQ